MNEKTEQRKLEENAAQLRSYTELVWHWYEMGNYRQAKNLRPAFMGQTRRQWIDEKMEVFLETRPNYLDGDEDGDEEGNWKGYKRSCLRDQFENKSSYYSFALDDGSYRSGAWYVMMTRESRQYLGPEEGGTWGGCSQFVKWTSFFTREEAKAFIEWYNANKKAPPTTDSLDLLGGDDTVSSTYPEGYIPRGFSFDKSLEVYLVILPYVPEPEPYYYE